MFSDDKNLMSIAQYVKDVQQSHKRSIPPLDQWHPKHCGKMDLKVKANGEWWHEGQLIKRQALLDLFSKVLWKEDAKYYLKTPVEQIEIEVEDEPQIKEQVQEYLDECGEDNDPDSELEIVLFDSVTDEEVYFTIRVKDYV